MRSSVRLLSILFSLVSTSALGQTTWEIDPAHSSVTFAVKHLVVSTVRGEFGKFAGEAIYDEKSPVRSIVSATLDAGSVNTREPTRDAHLKGADFFDVQKFPTITFKSSKVERLGKDGYKVVGALTLHGVTKPVTLQVTGPSAPVKTPFGQTVMAVSAVGAISRKDFGMAWNKVLDSGGLLVGDEVAISIDVELVKKQAGEHAAP
jgi:polyisoprenoid-binding protein YceI